MTTDFSDPSRILRKEEVIVNHGFARIHTDWDKEEKEEAAPLIHTDPSVPTWLRQSPLMN